MWTVQWVIHHKKKNLQFYFHYFFFIYFFFIFFILLFLMSIFYTFQRQKIYDQGRVLICNDT